MTLPPIRIQKNLRLIAHHDLGGSPSVGEGMAMATTPQGDRYLYVAHGGGPAAMSVLEVTDPSSPELVWQLNNDHDQVHSRSLAMYDDTLLLASQVDEPGISPAGLHVFDLTHRHEPERVGFFDTSGPHSRGVRFVTFMDGRHAHISTGAPDFEPKHPADHDFYMIVDLQDRSAPREVGRWWMPGQRVGDPEGYERHLQHDEGFRCHYPISYPQKSDRAYLGYVDGGLIILDITDRNRPRMISRYDYHPPLPGYSHTFMPLHDRGIAVVSDAAVAEDGSDWPKRYWIVDIRAEKNPVTISSFPVPDDFEDFRQAGRIGAHSFHRNEPQPGYAQLTRTCVATWFSAGLRVYDLRNPFTPVEIGAFVPETPEGQNGSRIGNVFVEDRGYVYAGDCASGGLYVLEWDGPIPLD